MGSTFSLRRQSNKYKIDVPKDDSSTNGPLPSPMCFRYQLKHGKNQQQEVTPTIVSEIPYDNLQHMCCCKDDNIWTYRRPKIVQLNRKGEELCVMEIRIEICGMVSTCDGDLIFTDCKNKNLISTTFGENSITKKVMSTEDWFPVGVCCAGNADILVCLFMPDSQGKVARYNANGETGNTIQYDCHGKQLYKFPAFICENNNGDICVSDHLIREVIVVDRWGRYRFSYNGKRSGTVSKEDFIPCGVCCDASLNIIIADSCNDCIQMINVNGEFINCLLTRSSGIFRPLSVAFDKNGELFVGDKNGIKVFSANKKKSVISETPKLTFNERL